MPKQDLLGVMRFRLIKEVAQRLEVKRQSADPGLCRNGG